jgi:dTDP-4-amino-4,6-dideoxygalactose transaminase
MVPQIASDRTHAYHLYTIRHPQRDKLAAHLNANGAQTAINYLPTGASIIARSNFRTHTAIKARYYRCRSSPRSPRNSNRSLSISSALLAKFYSRWSR